MSEFESVAQIWDEFLGEQIDDGGDLLPSTLARLVERLIEFHVRNEPEPAWSAKALRLDTIDELSGLF
mgnify:FL=1